MLNTVEKTVMPHTKLQGEHRVPQEVVGEAHLEVPDNIIEERGYSAQLYCSLAPLHECGICEK